MQKIIPNLWFDKEAEEAAAFYVAAFKEGSVGTVTRYGKSGAEVSGQPEGSVLTVDFSIHGYRFVALNGGPLFSFTPAISFMVNFDPSRDPQAREHLDELWQTLSEGGQALMPLQEYPFSKRYGWIQDKYGVTWQLMLTDPAGEERPFIIPSLLFTGDVYGKAEEAIDTYVTLFEDAKAGTMARYPAGLEHDREGTVMFADFMLAGQWFAAMDSGYAHAFTFTEAISLMVSCETQEEIDRFWQTLSAVPKAEQCGWLKDAYGVSWQIIPASLDALMADPDPAKAERAMQALFKMKKIDIAALEEAAEGKS